MRIIRGIVARIKDSILQNDELLDRAKDVVISKKLYLNPELRIQDVAREIGSNKTYLWRAFHLSDTSFVEFLTSLRIRYFVERAWLKEYYKLDEDSLARRCGFRSARVLNKRIKSIFGITLTVYMNRCDRGEI